MSTIYIEGKLTRVYKINNNNFYLIIVNGKKLAGVVNKELEKGMYLGFNVEKITQGKYKGSYKILSAVEVQPKEKNEIVKVLQGNIEGVGEKTAEKIYKHFGEEVIQILSNNPQKINEVDISDKTKKKIEQFFAVNYQNQELAIKLQQLGLSFNASYELIEVMKEQGYELYEIYNEICTDPYVILTYLPRVGFPTIDEIVKKMPNNSFLLKSQTRIVECVYYVLNQFQTEGHACMDNNTVLIEAQKLLELDLDNIKSILIDFEMTGDFDTYFSKYNNDIYLKRNFDVENIIAFYLYRLTQEKPNAIEIDVEELPDYLTNKQKEAIQTALTEKVTLLSGGPGTGKTTIIKHVIEYCKKNNLKFALCAPTGMASKKMSLSTGEEAKTIHRTLEVDMSTGTPRFIKDANNPIEADILIVDECSMIDMYLMTSLLKAVNPKTKLVLVGDPDQLPSVQAGKVFEDIINSGVFPHVHLDKIHRQGNNSLIVENAHRINNKQEIKLIVEPQEKDTFLQDFFFVNPRYFEEPLTEGEYILKLVTNSALTEKYNAVTDIQVLLPRKMGELGVLEYNKVLQEALNPKEDYKPEIIYKSETKNECIFRLNDKVMQISNNQEKEVYNGDIGYITNVETDKKSIKVKFDEDKVVDYSYDELEELMLSYAITVHKSQGSEYKVVIMPIVFDDYMMLYKKLVYTALTRAKELAIFVGDVNVLAKNLYARQEKKRKTNLDKIIREKFSLPQLEEQKVEIKEENTEYEYEGLGLGLDIDISTVKFNWS